MEVKKIIIIGLGEIGSAWFSVTEKLHAETLGIDIRERKERAGNDRKGITVMHICIPFIKQFEKTVISYMKEYKPDVAIINTSCKVGTTRNIFNSVKIPIAHLPVRGIHPHLDKGIKTFQNAIGPVNGKARALAESYLKALGIPYEVFNNPEETEMAKLLDTSYYGWNILFAKQVYELCREYKLDYEKVYTMFNKTYNEGYKKFGKENVIRPILYPPQVYNKKLGMKDNRIKGHCVRTNLEILKTMKKGKNIKFIDYAINLDES